MKDSTGKLIFGEFNGEKFEEHEKFGDFVFPKPEVTPEHPELNEQTFF